MSSPSGGGTATPFDLSGDNTIDALVNWGIKWGSGGAGTAALVTYSFPQSNQNWLSGYGDGEPFNGFQGFNTAQQNAARAALSLWSEVANIQFQEVPDTASDVGDIRFGFSRVVTNDPNSIAWGYFPQTYPEAGDMWFDRSYAPNLQMAPGQFGFMTLLHEIGHAIGLEHPFDDGSGEPVLPPSMDNNQYTVMAYDLHPTASVEAMTPMLLDILALQYIYGANMTTRLGNDSYKFSTSEQLRTIWDAGGIDTIDASNQTLGATIDLDDGAFSSIGRRNAGGSAQDNVAIAFGAIIENAKGGSGGDKIFGNEVANVLTGNAGNDTLDGRLGADTLRGGTGNDIYIVGAGDTIDEQGSKDLGDEIRIATSVNLATFAAGLIERATALGKAEIDLTGNNAANILTGNAAINVINGGAGADIMKGGGGNDVYYVDSAGDQIDEGSSKDSGDQIFSSVAVNLATLGKGQIEIATLTGSASVGVTGNTLNNVITGNIGNNALNGAAGNDKVSGGDGNDTLTDTLGNNTLDGGKGHDRATGGAGHDTLVGGGGNDTLTGGAGNDVLNGGGGVDSMNGGAGNDTYYVNSDQEKVTDLGTTDLNDAVVASISIDLAKFAAGLIEHATLIGDAALNALGNAKNNTITGNNGANLLTGELGNDILDGGLGADTMRGGKGNDMYSVDDAGDSVDEQGNVDTADRVRTSITVDLATFALGAIEHAELTGANAIDAAGNAAGNALSGNEAANALDGRDGDDTLAGNGGSDSMDGGIGNDQLDGGAENDALTGQAGNDTLNGGGGADTMKGGAGNDVYYVDNDFPFFSDIVDEEGNTDTADEIRASISVDLSVMGGGAIENAIAIEGTFAVVLTGNASANLLAGNSNSNRLDGGAGDDTMRGGAGSDLYTIDSLSDVIDEQGNKDTDDEIRTDAVSLNLSTYGGGAIEHVRLSGSADLTVTGNSTDNYLFGNDGNNTLDGGAGNDALMGGAGNDVLISGTGNDDLYGEGGNDLLIVPTIAGQILVGNAGFDEVKITTKNANIDLLTISDSALSEIESIDLRGAGKNTLAASALDIKSALTIGTDFFIKGDVGDSVLLTDTALHGGFKLVDGIGYNVYSYGSTLLHIQNGVSVTVTPPDDITVGEAPGFRIAGPSTFANGYSLRFGTIVGGVGDVNNDGFEDVLISSGHDAAYLLYGQADAFPHEFSADDAIGTGMAELAGAPGSWTGKGFSGLGDFNGDGKLDFAIAASNEDLNGIDSGGVYIVHGAGAGTLADESVPALAGSDGLIVSGPGSGARLGSYFAVQGGGDFNGDGYDDLLVATPDASSPSDRAAYMIFGSSGASDAFTLPALETGGFKFTAASGSQIGGTMALAGDLNGDGYDDLIVSTTAKSYVLFGGAQAFPSAITAESLNGSNGFSMSSGVSVLASGGDFNGDGYDDLVVADSWAGKAYVVFGSGGGFSSNLDLTKLNGSNGFAVQAAWIGNVGNGASLTGDYNADGYDDLLIGVPRVESGSALLIYGHAGTADPLVTLNEIDGQNGFRISGISSDDYTGAGVSSADINGDGFDDILIGSAFGDGDSKDSGTLDVLYGGDFRADGVIVGSADGNSLSGTGAGDRFVAAQGNDVISGAGGMDTINAGQGNDEIHVADSKFFRVDGGTGVDSLHLDYAGAIDFGNLDGNASTSDRNRIENVEVLDVDNGHANALTLHLADVLDLDATISDVGGIASLDNVLRIDGNAGDTLQMFNADGWGAADTSSLTGYAVYSYQAVKVAVDLDIAVSMT